MTVVAYPDNDQGMLYTSTVAEFLVDPLAYSQDGVADTEGALMKNEQLSESTQVCLPMRWV